MTTTEIITDCGASPLVLLESDAFIEAFKASQEVAPRTLASYVDNIGYYIGWLKENGRKGDRKADVIAYKKWLLERLTASSTATYITAVRVLYEFMEEYGVNNVAVNVHASKKKDRKHKKNPLSVEQVKHLLASMPRGTEAELRDYAIVNLMIRTGIRECEATRADIGDLTLVGDKMVLYVVGKGHTDRDDYVVVEPEALGPIEDYLKARGVHDKRAPLFASTSPRNRGGRLTTCSLSVMIKAALVGAGYDDKMLTGHSLRHTAVTLAVLGGCSKDQVQQMARHADPRTTQIYIGEIDRMTNAAEYSISAMLR